MKRYLLDTNVVSELRKPKPHGAVLSWIRDVPANQVFVPAIVFGEIQAGIEITRDRDPIKAQEIEAWADQLFQSAQVVNMDVPSFREWARLMKNQSEDMIEDAMIAASARVNGFTIATRNEADFKRFSVEIFNPFKC